MNFLDVSAAEVRATSVPTASATAGSRWRVSRGTLIWMLKAGISSLLGVDVHDDAE